MPDQLDDLFWKQGKDGDIVWELEDTCCAKLIPMLILGIGRNADIWAPSMELRQSADNKSELVCFGEEDGIYCICSVIITPNSISLAVGLNPDAYISENPYITEEQTEQFSNLKREVVLNTLFCLSGKFRQAVNYALNYLGIIRKNELYADSTVLWESPVMNKVLYRKEI